MADAVKEKMRHKKKCENQNDQIEELESMTVRELAGKYYNVFGEQTTSRNKSYLKKRVAYRIQELAYGGLSKEALERILVLALNAPIRRRQRNGSGEATRNSEDSNDREQPIKPLDPRLPPIGQKVSRVYKKVLYDVVVLTDGFVYEGRDYRSLSTIAKEITGTDWNGFAFFGLNKKKKASRRGAQNEK